MRSTLKHFINGEWRVRSDSAIFDVVNPATEEVSGQIPLGNGAEVDDAVAAARAAFGVFGNSSREERLERLIAIGAGFDRRRDELAEAISEEIGSPIAIARNAHLYFALEHIRVGIEALRDFEFEVVRGCSLVRLEPIGVCGLITPWNWPASVVMAKVVPALAVGCTIVLKPSEYAPYSAEIIAQIIEDAGYAPGVFNLVYGDGPTVGAAISGHPGIDAVSFTGSTRAGIEVARNAAATVKRVHQELGGKSPNILLPSADFDTVVPSGITALMLNSGQTCSAPSRMLVPNDRLEEVKAITRRAMADVTVGTPDSNAFIGPVINASQFSKIQSLIEQGIAEGATIVAGGSGRPAGFERGYYVQPTVFADTTPDMAIVREEIFGPVLVIQGYDDVEDAIAKATDTPYGLAAYVHGADLAQVRGSRSHSGGAGHSQRCADRRLAALRRLQAIG
ncbi:aldehyde dehydrogenase family protein [Sphingobium sp.]|uniref:aldehyde dehydrogenase family protein n=1 Tax=Sphingobium sp. TaxID=1912891 RepID=UPI0029C01E62|nr:aldehyde dehydrogenase family protein [Sphingobium sp.]